MPVRLAAGVLACRSASRSDDQRVCRFVCVPAGRARLVGMVCLGVSITACQVDLLACCMLACLPADRCVCRPVDQHVCLVVCMPVGMHVWIHV